METSNTDEAKKENGRAWIADASLYSANGAKMTIGSYGGSSVRGSFGVLGSTGLTKD